MTGIVHHSKAKDLLAFFFYFYFKKIYQIVTNGLTEDLLINLQKNLFMKISLKEVFLKLDLLNIAYTNRSISLAWIVTGILEDLRKIFMRFGSWEFHQILL